MGSHQASDDHWALNTTVRCQHRCIYCFEGDRKGHSDVPAESTKRLIDEAARHVPHVIFMGAEPTLNPQLPELVRYASSLGLMSSISTNALRLADGAFLRRLHDAGLGTIELSFPYPDQDVYARITGVQPKGFTRLLEALERIEQLNSAVQRKHPVNVNVVVSRFNVARLAEVVAHVACRFSVTDHMFTFKSVERPLNMSQQVFFDQVHVPCRQLRRRLPAMAHVVPSTTRYSFRNFPLCALPGVEHQDHDLSYWLRHVKVHHNFNDQSRVADMYPSALLRTRHAFQWICDCCAFDPVCLKRGIFSDHRTEDEYCPIARPLPIPAEFAAWVESFPRGSEAIRQTPAPQEPLYSWLLAALDRSTGGERRLGDDGVQWEPRETGVLLLRSRERTLRVRVAPASAMALARWSAGAWAVDLVELAPVGAMPPEVGALLDVLRVLPDVPRSLRPATHTSGWSRQSSIGDPSRTVVASDSAPLEAQQAVCVAWDEFVRRVVSAKVLNSNVDGCQASAEPPAGAHRDGRAVTLPVLRVLPLGAPKADGFLCGAVRVGIVPEAFIGPEGMTHLSTVARICLELSAADAWPKPVPFGDCPFLRDVWQAFGPALLPRSGEAVSLCQGSVGPEEVRLGFTTSDQARFEIVLLPARLARRPFARRASIGLQYHHSHTIAEHPCIGRVVRSYASKLVAWGDPARGQTQRSGGEG